jgi:hypothetical protein
MKSRTGHRRAWIAAVALAAGVGGAGSPALTQPRGDGPAARERTAVEMCARELRNRENARGVRVDRTIRSDCRNDRVSWDGYMSIRRDGPDLSRRVACVVDFAGKNRIVSFDVSGGGGSGGGSSGGDRVTRACSNEAERAGYDVAGVAGAKDVEDWGRLVVLRVGGRRELLCLYRNGARLYRPA